MDFKPETAAASENRRQFARSLKQKQGHRAGLEHF